MNLETDLELFECHIEKTWEYRRNSRRIFKCEILRPGKRPHHDYDETIRPLYKRDKIGMDFLYDE